MSARKYFTPEEKRAAKAARNRAWCAANPERVAEFKRRGKEYLAANPEKVKQYRERDAAHSRSLVASGVCRNGCGRPSNGRWLCSECKAIRLSNEQKRLSDPETYENHRDRSRKSMQSYRTRKRLNGLCEHTGCWIKSSGERLCEKHRLSSKKATSSTAMKRYRERKEMGLCGGCGGSPEPGRVSCRKCRDASNNATLRRKYGISLGEYRSLLSAADGKCAVCESSKRLHLDHDHATGYIRGILCQECNVALGLMKEDDARLRALSDYVVLHREVQKIPRAV